MWTSKDSIACLMTATFILTICYFPGNPSLANPPKGKSDDSRCEERSGLQQEKPKYEYVGVEKCASVCHNNEKMGFQYDIWKTSIHAESFKILNSKKARRYAREGGVKVNPQESSACLKCHTTGGELDSSYFTASYKKEEGVTCEACHKHEYLDKTYLPGKTDCLKCHNDSFHKIQKFDFGEKSAKIAHPRPKVEAIPPK
jgi:hypothetical protein